MQYNLLNEIIDKYERGNDWRGLTGGTRSLSFEKTTLYDKYGKSSLVAEAIQWEAEEIVRCKWLEFKSDLERVSYSLERIPQMYGITGRTPKLERIRAACAYMEEQMHLADRGWVRAYYRDVMEQLEKGNWPEELDRCGQGSVYGQDSDCVQDGTCNQGHLHVGSEDYVNLLFQCLNALSSLHNPIYKRIFSNYCFKDSKLFERRLESRVLTISRRYFDDIDENMNDSQALSQLYIEEYSQELCVKGDLLILQDGEKIDLSSFIYGTVLNSEMLKHVTIPPGQKLKRVITVENKANYMSMPYEPGCLIIFSHGYFSPKERELLRELEVCLRGRPVEYFHTGDLDYGGVCIFRYIRQQIFPQLQPFQMDAEQYRRYVSQAVPMEESSWEKLNMLEEPVLQPLIECILKEKKVIEQESFLMPC